MTSLYFSILYYFAHWIIWSTLVTLGFYIILMGWKKKGIDVHNAAWWQKVVGYVGALCDVVYNYTTLTIVLMQFPRRGETLATDRLKRTKKQTGWRAGIAKCYCWLLQLFDPTHCE